MQKPILDHIQNRRSCRQFTSQPIEKEIKNKLIKAALWSPTSKNNRPWEFVFVENKQTIEQLSQCKPHGSAFMSGATLAIVILGDPEKSDVWIEDCSIAAILLQMVAEDLGLGSTWVQVRCRQHSESLSSDLFIKQILKAPDHLQVASIIAFGHKAKEREPYSKKDLLLDRIHIDSI